MYEISGKYGRVRLCRSNLIPREAGRIQPPFTYQSGGWHRCNDLYHINRPQGNDNYLVFFSLTEGGVVKIQNKSYDVPASSIIIIPPDIPHEYFTRKGALWEFYWFHASSRNLDILEELIRIRGNVFPFPKTAKAGKLLENLFPEHTEPDMSLFHITASGILSDILHILAEAAFEITSESEKNKGIVSSVIREIEENYSEELNIAKIASGHFISQQHLNRLFKAETEYTPYEYLKKYRLKKSMELLTYSDLPIETIAERSGFSGASNYIFQFRNEYGITPSRYRKYFY